MRILCFLVRVFHFECQQILSNDIWNKWENKFVTLFKHMLNFAFELRLPKFGISPTTLTHTLRCQI